MLQPTRLLPGAVHQIEFMGIDSYIKLMDQTAQEIVLFIGIKNDDSSAVVNNFTNGSWGEEVLVLFPKEEAMSSKTIWFKYNGKEIEIWTDKMSFVFNRGSSDYVERIRLSEIRGVIDKSNSLNFRVITPEVMAAEINHTILRNRIELIEESLRLPKN